MKWVITSFLLLTLVFYKNPVVHAEVGQDTITIEPANLEFRLNDQEEQTVLVAITNQYDTTVSLQAELQNVEEDTGRIIPAGPLSSSLANVITVAEKKLTIPAQSRHYLKITVKDNAQLPAGGQYAALVLSDVSRADKGFTVHPQVSIGIFIVKKQSEVKLLQLTKHDLRKKAFQFPRSFNFQLVNEGNVHLVPRGYVRLYDTKNVYFETILNTQSQSLIPGQAYSQELALTTQPKGWMPRRITFEFGHRADGIDEIQKYSVQFWYIPWVLIPVISVMACLIFILGWFIIRRQRLTSH